MKVLLRLEKQDAGHCMSTRHFFMLLGIPHPFLREFTAAQPSDPGGAAAWALVCVFYEMVGLGENWGGHREVIPAFWNSLLGA